MKSFFSGLIFSILGITLAIANPPGTFQPLLLSSCLGPTPVSTNIGTNLGSGASLSITVPGGGVPSGSLIVLVSEDTGSTTPGGSVADTAGNSYSVAASIGSVGAVGSLRIWFAYNSLALSSGNTIVYTKISAGGSGATISAMYATNILAISNPNDSGSTATNSGSGTSPTVTSNNLSQNGELMIAVTGWCVTSAVCSGSATFTQDSVNGWSIPPNSSIVNELGIAGGNQINNGTSSKIFNPSLSSISGWNAAVTSFKRVGC